MRRIYMDYAATTPLLKEVLDEMMPALTSDYGNPSSVHASGREARRWVEQARERVARAINADKDEIYFTGSATEADNWALMGAVLAAKDKNKGTRIVTSAIEHHAVLETAEWLHKKWGCPLTILPVDGDGLVSPGDVGEALSGDTAIVSIMLANNEIGTIEPIAEIGEICRERGVLLHTDAVQAIGAVPVDVKDLNIDMLSMSAHKFGGPKGVGALYLRKGARIEPLIHGGAHENRRRAGTENVAGIVGMGKAIELATSDIPAYSAGISAMRDRLISGILKRIPDTRLNGHRTKRLPGNVNVSIKYVEGESLLLGLDLEGVLGSSGSACTSGSLDPSHVLLAIGLPHEIAHGSLRLTLGGATRPEDIDDVLNILPGVVERLRRMSPLWPGNN